MQMLSNLIPRINFRHWFRYWRGDLFGGLTAAIVALPLALSFGVSSGAGAIAGLYGAIVVGFFAALCGGTPTQVSGPTGPMTVVMTSITATLMARHPETGLAMAFTVVMLGGLWQILFGFIRLGQYITLMPYPVISGFMSGIGGIIILLQLPLLLGHAAAGGVIATLQQLPADLSHPNPIAMALGLLTLTIVWLMPRRLSRIVPAPLIALVTVTVLSVVGLGDIDLARIGTIPQGLPSWQSPTLDLADLATMLRYGLTLGVLGAIDSLLTALVADRMSRTAHDADRELIGQGVANLLAGLFGGLPGAGATMRTVVNIQAGGKTRLSGMIHALVLLLVVFGAAPLMAPIPTAVLAGLLLKVGIDIIDWEFIKRAPSLSLKTTGLMYLVLFLTVFVDLITAVLMGSFVANIMTIKRLSDCQSEQIRLTTEDQILILQLSGPMSFGAVKTITQQMALNTNHEVLILDLSEVSFFDTTVALAIEALVLDAIQRHCPVWISVGAGQAADCIARLNFQRLMLKVNEAGKLPRLVLQVNALDDRLEALQWGQMMIAVNPGAE
jgi:sulfate permease, SulP family